MQHKTLNFPAVLLLCMAVGIGACTPWLERGEFSLVVPAGAAGESYETLSTAPVTGSACFTGRQADDLVFSWAVEDALQQPAAAGATLLLDATYTNYIEDKSTCLRVVGLPARLRNVSD
jgi:hypothetical protein